MSAYLHGEPEALALDGLQRLEQARLEIDLATAPVEEVRQRIDDGLRMIERIQAQRDKILAGQAQRSNIRVQRAIALGTIGSMIVAVVGIVIALWR